MSKQRSVTGRLPKDPPLQNVRPPETEEQRIERERIRIALCPWLCATCHRHHANACSDLWGGDFVQAPCGHTEVKS